MSLQVPFHAGVEYLRDRVLQSIGHISTPPGHRFSLCKVGNLSPQAQKHGWCQRIEVYLYLRIRHQNKSSVWEFQRPFTVLLYLVPLLGDREKPTVSIWFLHLYRTIPVPLAFTVTQLPIQWLYWETRKMLALIFQCAENHQEMRTLSLGHQPW